MPVRPPLPRTLGRRIGWFAGAALLTGCAAVPDVTIRYRPVTWKVGVTVVHTVTCTHDSKGIVFDQKVAFTPGYGPDERAWMTLNLKDLDRFFADTDLAVEFTTDGRLRSINHSSTGQSEPIIKSFVEASAAVSARVAQPPFLLPGGAPPSSPTALPAAAGTLERYVGNKRISNPMLQVNGKEASVDEVCKVVASFSRPLPNNTRQVSVAQSVVLGPDVDAGRLETAPSDEKVKKALEEVGVPFEASLEVRRTGDAGSDGGLQPVAIPVPPSSSDVVSLPLQGVERIEATVRVTVVQRDEQKGPLSKRETLSTDSFLIPVAPSAGRPFALPIPKAALFGRQTFSLQLGEAGQIVKLSYGRTVGTTGALGATATLAGAGLRHDQVEAAMLKAANDLVVEQNRDRKCREEPLNCPK